jgi:hypothetical protein
MSALPSVVTGRRTSIDVGFVPIADIERYFDHRLYPIMVMGMTCFCKHRARANSGSVRFGYHRWSGDPADVYAVWRQIFGDALRADAEMRSVCSQTCHVHFAPNADRQADIDRCRDVPIPYEGDDFFAGQLPPSAKGHFRHLGPRV